MEGNEDNLRRRPNLKKSKFWRCVDPQMLIALEIYTDFRSGKVMQERKLTQIIMLDNNSKGYNTGKQIKWCQNHLLRRLP
jgi:hypothetical protein